MEVEMGRDREREEEMERGKAESAVPEMKLIEQAYTCTSTMPGCKTERPDQ